MSSSLWDLALQEIDEEEGNPLIFYHGEPDRVQRVTRCVNRCSDTMQAQLRVMSDKDVCYYLGIPSEPRSYYTDDWPLDVDSEKGEDESYLLHVNTVNWCLQRHMKWATEEIQTRIQGLANNQILEEFRLSSPDEITLGISARLD